MPKALLIIAQQNYQDIELNGTKDALTEKGVDCEIASPTGDSATGKLGGVVTPDLAIKDASVDNYEAIVTIGGPGAPSLINVHEYNDLVKASVEKDKITAAICIASTLLAKNGLLTGKRATVWNGDGQQGPLLESHGATFVDEEVVIDEKIITGNGPSAAKKFGETIAEALA